MENFIWHLDPKTRELIAIGASIGSNCLPCLRYHFSEATKSGCTISEIEEAIQISEMVKERPKNDISKLAKDLIRKAKEVEEL